MPLFSIVIPVYNVEKYLDECLKSVINQTFEDYEIIIINDGSTDNSLNICNRYAENNKKIRIFNQKNQGLAAARNNGVEKTNGEFIVFLDSDDYLANNLCLKKMAESIKNDTELLIYGFKKNTGLDPLLKKQMEVFFDLSDDTYTGEEYLKKMTRTTPYYSSVAWRMAYNKKYWIENKFGFPVGRAYEDLALTWKVICRAKNIAVLREFIYVYRVDRPNSITKVFSEKQVIDHLEILKNNVVMLQDEKASYNLKSEIMKIFATEYFNYLLELGGHNFTVTAKTNKLLKEAYELLKGNKKRLTHEVISLIIMIFGFYKGIRIIGKIRHFIYKISKVFM